MIKKFHFLCPEKIFSLFIKVKGNSIKNSDFLKKIVIFPTGGHGDYEQAIKHKQ